MPARHRTVPATRPWAVLAVAASAFFLVGLDTTLLNVAFDTLRADFPGTSQQALSWAIAGYVTVTAALIISAGRSADVYGRRRVFMIGVAIMMAGATCAALAPTPGLLISARVVQAVGAAFVTPTSLALVLTAFPAHRRATAVGVWGAVGAIAASAGPGLGGLIVDTIGWRWVFVFPLPIAATVLFLAPRIVPESADPHADRRPDPLGVVLIALALGGLVLAIIQSDDWGWLDSWTLAALATAVTSGAVFLVRARSQVSPVLDPALFRLRSFWSANAVSVVFSMAFAGMVLANVLYLQRVWGYTAAGAGFGISPSPMLAALLAPFAGRAADSIGPRRIIVTGVVLFSCGMLWLWLVVGDEVDYWRLWFPGTLLFGSGIGLAFTNVPAAALRDVPAPRFAVASGINNTTRLIGQALGPALVLGLTAGVVGTGAADAFDAVYVRLLVISVAALPLALLLPGARTA